MSMTAEEMLLKLGDLAEDNQDVSGVVEQSCPLHGSHSENGAIFEQLADALPNIEIFDPDATQQNDNTFLPSGPDLG